jgi:hypothetical protein
MVSLYVEWIYGMERRLVLLWCLKLKGGFEGLVGRYVCMYVCIYLSIYPRSHQRELNLNEG